MRPAVALAIGMVLVAVGGAKAASFDCKKAASRTERVICDDPNLDALDSQLEGAYLGALDRSIQASIVTDKQRAWLRQRDACADAKCLSAAYQRQIALLSTLSDEPPSCAGASTPEMNACAAEYSRRGDRELERYLAAARKRLIAAAGEEETAQTARAALAGLDTAQTSWTAYRKAECGAVYDWWSAGTIRGVMHHTCWLGVTKARTTAIWDNWLNFMDDTPALMPKPFEK